MLLAPLLVLLLLLACSLNLLWWLILPFYTSCCLRTTSRASMLSWGCLTSPCWRCCRCRRRGWRRLLGCCWVCQAICYASLRRYACTGWPSCCYLSVHLLHCCGCC
jgi:hypothetical protein